jgi:phenylalanine-4-hydroxylase
MCASPARRDTGPVADDHTIDQNWGAYSDEEHDRWNRLSERMMTLLPGRASRQYLAALDALPLAGEGVPDLARLSEKLAPLTGWRVVAVPGLVPDAVFFEHLANRRFPAGAFLRTEAEFDYIEEPDIFHDVFGHVPLLASPAYAAFMEAYGRGGHRALAMAALPALARLYWYTIEFGLIREGGGTRIFGAGIMSSPRETVFAREDPSPNRIGFDLERVMRTAYRIDDFQQTYFVIESFETLLAATEADFGPIYDRVRAEAPLPPETVLDTDAVLHRGRKGISGQRPEPVSDSVDVAVPARLGDAAVIPRRARGRGGRGGAARPGRRPLAPILARGCARDFLRGRAPVVALAGALAAPAPQALLSKLLGREEGQGVVRAAGRVVQRRPCRRGRRAGHGCSSAEAAFRRP